MYTLHVPVIKLLSGHEEWELYDYLPHRAHRGDIVGHQLEWNLAVNRYRMVVPRKITAQSV